MPVDVTTISGTTSQADVTHTASQSTATAYSPPSTTENDCIICDYDIPVAQKVLRVVLGLCITLANSVMVYAVLRAKSLQVALQAFLVNVALADALMGLAFAYLSLVVDVWPHFSLECRFRYGSLSYLNIVTLYSILVFSAQQVVTVAWPLRAAQLVTKTTLAVTLALLWLLPAVMTTVAYEMRDGAVTECYFGRFTGTGAFLIFSIINTVAIILVVVCQVIIFALAKSQVNKIASTMVGGEAHHRMNTMNLRVAVTTLCVVTPFLLLSTPLLGGFLHLAIHPESRNSKAYLPVITTQFIFTIVNAMVDPVVFCVRLKSVRHELRRIGHAATCGRCCSDAGHVETITTS